MLQTLEKMRKINAAELSSYPLVNIPKTSKNYGKSPFLMGTSTISVAMFNSKLFVYQRVLFSVDLRVFVPFVPSFC